jgi:hypothetical protein
MDLITFEQRVLLLRNGAVAKMESLLGRPPVLKLFTPDAAGTWLISAIDPADADRAWGLCDPGLGSPELGWVSLAELASVRGPLGCPVRRDEAFEPNSSLRAYTVEAQRVGIVIA